MRKQFRRFIALFLGLLLAVTPVYAAAETGDQYQENELPETQIEGISFEASEEEEETSPEEGSEEEEESASEEESESEAEGEPSEYDESSETEEETSEESVYEETESESSEVTEIEEETEETLTETEDSESEESEPEETEIEESESDEECEESESEGSECEEEVEEEESSEIEEESEGEEILSEGELGSDLTWNLDDQGVLTISGSGAMNNFYSSSYTPYYEYADQIKKIEIGDQVTTIGNYAFSGLSSLKEIVLGSGLVSIGYYAFYGCGLYEIIIPSSVTSIGNCAFQYNNDLSRVYFEGDAPELGRALFYRYNNREVRVYYQKDKTGFSDVSSDLGSNCILCAVSDIKKVIKYPYRFVSGGIAGTGVYALSTSLFPGFSNVSEDMIFQPSAAAGGVYFLSEGVLYFMPYNTGNAEVVRRFSDELLYFDEDNLYILTGNILEVFHFASKSVSRSVKLSSTAYTYTAVGVDPSGRIYVIGSDDSGSQKLLVFSASGTKLKGITTPITLIDFAGFDNSGNFYVTFSSNFVYWGYDHYGTGVTSGTFDGSSISLDTLYHYVEIGMISVPIQGIEYLLQAGYQYHYKPAEVIDHKYLVTRSTTFGTMRFISSSSGKKLFSVSVSGSPEYSDPEYIGTRVVCNDKHKTFLMVDDSGQIIERLKSTGREVNTISPAYPVFSMKKSGNQLVLLERSGSKFYIEIIDISDPEVIEVNCNEEMTVSEIQTLSCNVPLLSVSVSDKSIASVNSNGRICAWKAGTVTITLKLLDGRTKEITLTVKDKKTSKPTAVKKTASIAVNNARNNSYTTWASAVKSYLYEENDLLTSVKYDGTYVIVETYNSDMTVSETKKIKNPMEYFGGFYCGSKYNYLVFGNSNAEESDSKEVMRVVRYSKSWSKGSSTSVKGANTYCAFDAGSLRMTETDGKLYVHTCHTMYASSDGYHHQANMTYVIRESDMTLLDSYYDVMNIGYGYVSHSFNQFIQTDGEYIYRVDHGDANPRGVALTRFNKNDKVTDVSYIVPVFFGGQYGANYTGASIGGFELSTENCLITGSSVAFDASSLNGQQNVFVSISNKDLTSTKAVWLTDYSSSANIKIETPQLVKLNEEQFLVMWTEVSEGGNGDSRTCFRLISSEGEVIGSHYSSAYVLSDCQPILRQNGSVCWFTSDGNTVSFYGIDPYHLGNNFPPTLDECEVKLQYTTVEFDYYSSKCPSVLSVKYNGKELTEGSSYTVSYSNNWYMGYAYVHITGKGKYYGSKTLKFSITPPKTGISSIENTESGVKLTWKQNDFATGYQIYRSTDKKTWTKVKSISKNTTTSYTDTEAVTNCQLYYYKIRPYYKDYYGIVVTAPFGSVKTICFMKRSAIVSAENTGSGKITVKWKTNSKAAGYQIKYVIGKTSKVITVEGSSTAAKSITGLLKGNTYSIYVRCFKVSGSKKYYSAWSKVKKVEVTK